MSVYWWLTRVRRLFTELVLGVRSVVALATPESLAALTVTRMAPRDGTLTHE